MTNQIQDEKSLTDPHLLEKIDKLFACNVGEYVHLPQLVVVGDQSSGKSSVLEGLTGVPFPRDSRLCTRFATQISFRRDPVQRTNVTIIPGSNASEEHKTTVKAFTQNDVRLHDVAAFAHLINQVRIVMGIPRNDSGEASGSESPFRSETESETEIGAQHTSFSDDVLRLEICGPHEEHLTVIDVPGIFRTMTEGETTMADRDMVRNMVNGYMANPKSLILAVVPASVDIATQEILDIAGRYDPQGIRTLGVLTKPDLVDGGAHQPIFDVLEGRRHKLTLGWHIVRNPGQRELNDPDPTQDRHTIEKAFFRDTAPWNSLNKDKVSIGKLRINLQKILASHIRREYPKVKAEINKRLQDRRKELQALGTTRETPGQQRSYLLEMSMEFQRLVDLAVSAKYGGSDVFEEHPDLRLATAVVSRNESFAALVEAGGHSFYFDKSDTVKEIGKYTESRRSSLDSMVQDFETAIELVEIAPGTAFVKDPEQNILPWLKKVFETSRGFELGTFDASVLAVTMRKQSANWEPLANGYITDIATLIQHFIKELLHIVCAKEQVRDSLLSILHERLLDRYRKAFDHVRFVLNVERDGVPLTVNNFFKENLKKARQRRVRVAAREFSFSLQNTQQQVVSLEEIVRAHPLINGDHVVRDIHDILHSYYEVARTRFVDTICMQGAAYHLVTGPDTPLRVFSARFVTNMTDDELQDVAGDDALIRANRAALEKEIADLEAGSKIIL